MDDKFEIEESGSEVETGSISEKLRATLKRYADAKRTLRSAEHAFKEAKRHVEQLEQDTLPNVLDEAQVLEVTLSDGVRVEYRETIYTTLKRVRDTDSRPMADARGAIAALRAAGIDDSSFFEAVYVINQDVFDNLGLRSDDVLEITDVRHRYNPSQSRALGRELLASGIELPSDAFSQYVKRGVKITYKK